MSTRPPPSESAGSDALPDDYRPARARTAASVEVDGLLILAHESGDRPLVLDPISAATWRSLDGHCSVAEIVEDLTDALGGDPAVHRVGLGNLLVELNAQQLLSSGFPADGLVPRSFRAPLDPSNCIGKQIGLGRSTYGQLTVDGVTFAFGATEASTVNAILDRLPGTASFTDPDPDGGDSFILRETSGRTARVQQLLDGFGNIRWIGTDLAEAHRALAATVATLVSGPGSGNFPLVDGPILRTDAGAALLHPALRSTATSIMRSDLAANGVSFLPAAVARFRRAGKDGDRPMLELPVLEHGDPPELIPLNGLVLPGPVSALVDAVVAAAHVIHTWDDAGLAAALDLVERLPVGVVHSGAPGIELFERLCDAAWGRI